MTARVRWRSFASADLAACLDLQRGQLGQEIIGEAAARRVWSEILEHPACISAVFEAQRPSGTTRIVGFGVSVFVTSDFANYELAHPQIDFNARLFKRLHDGDTILLNSEQIARVNAATGMDMAVLQGSWGESGLGERELQEVRVLLPTVLAQLTAGFRVRTMFGQATGDQVDYMRKSGLVQELGTYPEINQVFNLMTGGQVLDQPASVVSSLFLYERPVLGLSEAEQQLLCAALDGTPDGVLATQLGLNLSAIKARWRSIFERFARISTDALPDEKNGRGPQKRHLVLSYLRQHPEELRPFKPQ
ncbi:MAG: hypothetical protein ABJC26_10610 [Gemmatimonadaceae bacterium]